MFSTSLSKSFNTIAIIKFLTYPTAAKIKRIFDLFFYFLLDHFNLNIKKIKRLVFGAKMYLFP